MKNVFGDTVRTTGYMADDFVDNSLVSRLRAVQTYKWDNLTNAQKQYVEAGIEALGSGKQLPTRIIVLLDHIAGGW